MNPNQIPVQGGSDRRSLSRLTNNSRESGIICVFYFPADQTSHWYREYTEEDSIHFLVVPQVVICQSFVNHYFIFALFRSILVVYMLKYWRQPFSMSSTFSLAMPNVLTCFYTQM